MVHMIERERLQQCFELVDDIVTRKENENIHYESEEVTNLAAKAILALVPELFEWRHGRVRFEVDRCFAVLAEGEGVERSRYFTDAQFRGVLKSASIVQRTQEADEMPGFGIVTYDVCAVVTPAIDKVSEDDLVLSERIVVPIRDARFMMLDS